MLTKARETKKKKRHYFLISHIKPRAVHVQYIYGFEPLTFGFPSVGTEMRIDRRLSACSRRRLVRPRRDRSDPGRGSSLCCAGAWLAPAPTVQESATHLVHLTSVPHTTHSAPSPVPSRLCSSSTVARR